jgi:hypothetical protein
MDSESSRPGKVRRTAQQIQQLVAQFHRGGQTMDRKRQAKPLLTGGGNFE